MADGGTTLSFVVLPAPTPAPVAGVVVARDLELPRTGFAVGDALLLAALLLALGVVLLTCVGVRRD